MAQSADGVLGRTVRESFPQQTADDVAVSPLLAELCALGARAAARLAPPPVAAAFINEQSGPVARDAEFGLVALEDGSAGLYYAWLGAGQQGMAERFHAADLAGRPVQELLRFCAGPDDAARSIGIAALNAVTEHTWRRAGFAPPTSADSFAGIAVGAGDHLGLIGNFPSLVRQALGRGARVSVVERKAHMVTREGALEISLDPAVLAPCRSIICTGATLLNDSLADMLPHCRNAEVVALVGPTVGFFPDPLFARGIHRVAGTRVLDAAAASARLAGGERLGESGLRFLLTAGDYPGFDALLSRAGPAEDPFA